MGRRSVAFRVYRETRAFLEKLERHESVTHLQAPCVHFLPSYPPGPVPPFPGDGSKTLGETSLDFALAHASLGGRLQRLTSYPGHVGHQPQACMSQDRYQAVAIQPLGSQPVEALAQPPPQVNPVAEAPEPNAMDAQQSRASSWNESELVVQQPITAVSEETCGSVDDAESEDEISGLTESMLVFDSPAAIASSSFCWG